MRDKIFYPLVVLFVLFATGIAVIYPGSYGQVASAGEFLRFAWFIASKILFVVILAASAYSAGSAVFKKILPEFPSLGEEAIFKVGLGLILISYAMFIVAAVGILYTPAGYIVLVAGFLAGMKDLKSFIVRARGAARFPSLTAQALVVIAVSTYFMVIGLYQSFMPPTGFDVLMYHYGVPKLFLKAHRMYPTDVSGSPFPMGIEMLFMLGMMFGGAVTANLVNFSFVVMAGAAAYLFTRRFLPSVWPLFSFGVFVCVPMVVWLMPQAYVELGMTAFAMLAFYAGTEYVRDRSRGWLVLTALFAGFTMAIKYTGIIIAGLLFLSLLANGLLRRKEGLAKTLRACGVFALVCLAASFPWYVRNLIWYNNPVFPFFATQGSVSGVAYGSLWTGGPLDIAWEFISFAWRTTFDCTDFKISCDSGFGPLFLAFIPGLLIFKNVEREIKDLFMVSIALFFLSMVLLQENMRYLSFLMGPFAVIAAYPGGRLLKDKKLFTRAAGWLVLAIFVFGAFTANVTRDKYTAFAPLTPDGVDQYYADRPSGYLASYPVWQWINTNLPDDAVIYQLWDDASVYFRDRKTFGAALPWGATGREKLHFISGFNDFAGYLPGEQIISNLKAMGANYLLINVDRVGHALPQDPYFMAHTRLVVSANGVFLYQLLP